MLKISKANLCKYLAKSLEKLEEYQGSFVCPDITLESGNIISIVDAHCFMLDSGKWIAAQNLKSGMNLRPLQSRTL